MSLASWPLALHAAALAPASCILLVYSAIVSLLLGMLVTYHAYLVARNETTYENVRGQFADAGSNPFDQGWLRNFGEVFCSPCVPPVRWVPHDESNERESGTQRHHQHQVELSAAAAAVPPLAERHSV